MVKVSFSFTQLLFLFVTAAVRVHAQLQTGFISIDCGGPVNFNYVDIDTGISYSTDGLYTDSGTNHNISSQYAYPNNPNLPQPLSDLRSFPQGHKNCYTLRHSAGPGSLNLIRASFFYANYDGTNRPPQFDLYLDVNLWSTVRFQNSSDVVVMEILSVAQSEVVYVCLVNTGNGVPFISALELRPLNKSIYGTEYGKSASLVLFRRLNIGSSNSSARYADDVYDRLWSSYIAPSWAAINTSVEIDTTANGYKLPFQVLRTAARPGNNDDSLEVHWTSSDSNDEFYVFLHFAEVEVVMRNQTRRLNVSWNGSQLFGPFSPRYLYAETLSNSRPLIGKDHRISIYKTSDSTLPPILNAIEIYRVQKTEELMTNDGDVDAINSVKSSYGIRKNWIADPCGPKNFSWEGVICNYTELLAPQVISLNLSSSGLTGSIVSAIAKLSSLESLDLSNNSLSGPVPEFIEELQLLKYLNLKGNQLQGTVPSGLLKRSKNGLLSLSVDDRNLCVSGLCKKKKKKIAVPIIAAVLSALALVVALVILLIVRRKKRLGKSPSSKGGRYLASKKRHFGYAEVVSITNNFETIIGKGGFGNVYLGHLKDGVKVAVKMLSQTSSQGSREFEAEAELLLTVHHRNLVSFVGYCDECNNMALIYEFMANGNLKSYLSDKSSHMLSWELRLRIATDAAQGLEYLHYGCKPPRVHRDVKTANILLSENMDAKIADFGLSKVIQPDYEANIKTSVMGTTGYLDPEYYITQNLNEKSDVYSFGVVLLELITGQSAIVKGEERLHILEWISPFVEAKDVKGLIDQRLEGDFDMNSMCKALDIAMTCTAYTSLQRPTMRQVLSELKHCLEMEVSSERERKEMEMPRKLSHSSSPKDYSMSMEFSSVTAR